METFTISTLSKNYEGDTVLIEMPAMVEANISFAKKTIKINLSQCHPDALRHCIVLGFRRFLNEGGSVKTKDDKGKALPAADVQAAKMAGLKEHQKQLKSGKIRTRSGGGALDEVFKQMREILVKTRKETANKIAEQFKSREDIVGRYGETATSLMEERAKKNLAFLKANSEMADLKEVA